jgi:hypothetical protein
MDMDTYQEIKYKIVVLVNNCIQLEIKQQTVQLQVVKFVFNNIHALNVNQDHMFIMNLLQEFNHAIYVILGTVNNASITITIAVIALMVMQLTKQMENARFRRFKDAIILSMDIVHNVTKVFYYRKI